MSSPTSSGSAGSSIFVTGGTGFVGSRMVKKLARKHRVRLLVRPGSKPNVPADVELVEGDVSDADSLTGKLDGCEMVVHLVGIIEEHGDVTFDRIIRQGTVNVVDAAKKAGIGRFIHMSALGAQDNPKYAYHTAKFRAEEAVKASGMTYTIFRPSVIFGKGDGFVTVLAGVVKSFPITPIAGSGEARFQPVQVDDVSDSFLRAVDEPGLTANQTYELGGGRVYTYEEMMETISAKVGVKHPKVHIPLPLMNLVVAVSAPLPKAIRPPVTSEQLKMLTLDNSTEFSATEGLIGRTPVALGDGIDYLLG